MVELEVFPRYIGLLVFHACVLYNTGDYERRKSKTIFDGETLNFGETRFFIIMKGAQEIKDNV